MPTETSHSKPKIAEPAVKRFQAQIDKEIPPELPSAVQEVPEWAIQDWMQGGGKLNIDIDIDAIASIERIMEHLGPEDRKFVGDCLTLTPQEVVDNWHTDHHRVADALKEDYQNVSG